MLCIVSSSNLDVREKFLILEITNGKSEAPAYKWANKTAITNMVSWEHSFVCLDFK